MDEDVRLLTLTVMVKNEAGTIARTLASAAPFVDRWVVLDTGSTDGTQDAVRAALRGVPGTLHEEPFVDFATSRNRALALAGEATPYVLWLDADDTLEGGAALRQYVSEAVKHRDVTREAFYVRVELSPSGVRFDSARVLDTRAGWAFRGAVHEVLTKDGRPPPSRRIDGVVVRHEASPDGAVKSRERWERDVHLLRGEVARDPTAARAWFYLALTYHWLGRHEEAISAFDRRVALGGWQEEVFYAHLTKARSAAALDRPWPDVMALYLAAHEAGPRRPEPLFDLAMRYHHKGEHAACVLFARRGWELPAPAADALFVEEDVSAYKLADLVGSHAYWIGDFELGERAARQAAAARPDDERLARNVVFYAARR